MGKRNQKFSKDDQFEKKSDKFSKSSKSGGKKWNKKDKWHESADSKYANDVSWYAPDPQLLKDAGRWPYSTPVGTPLSRNSILNLADASDRAVPGIISIGIENTIGPCSDGADAPNVAANAVFTYVRHQNSGARNYDANDIMLYLTAMDSIYSSFAFITRAYATVNLYAMMNKYLPDHLGKAQFVDLDSIRANMANFRINVNSRIMKVGSLVVPDCMDVFRRHNFMFQQYYSEGANIKDQLYLWYPKSIYVFKLDSNGAGMLERRALRDYFNNNGLLDAAGMIQILDDMITPIFNDEDFNIMGGDMLKAYGDKIFKLGVIPDDILAVPVNNYEVLMEFKNMRVWNMNYIPTASTDLDIVQDSNKEFLISKITDPTLFTDMSGTVYPDSAQSTAPDIYTIAYDELSRPVILTTENLDVSPEENMANTRLTVHPEIILDASKPSGLAISDLAYGTEIPVSMHVWWVNKNKALRNISFSSVITYDATNTNDLDKLVGIASILSQFRFHPNVVLLGYDTSSSPATYITGSYLYGIDNFTIVDYDHLKQIHDVAILGEYNIPRLAVTKG